MSAVVQSLTGDSPVPSTGGATSAITPTTEFGMSQRNLGPTGRNEHFVLEPGFQIVLEGGGAKLAITVLNETKNVNGVVTRVIEEKEWRNGQVIEVARNFFAIDEQTKDVFYFGEDVDNYQNGKIINNNGTWLVGQNRANPGLIMPGQPKVGMRYFQEVSPGVAMDYASVVSLDITLKTPAGSFSNCLKTEEGNALNPQEKEFKFYAPGVGLVQEGTLFLTQYGFVR